MHAKVGLEQQPVGERYVGREQGPRTLEGATKFRHHERLVNLHAPDGFPSEVGPTQLWPMDVTDLVSVSKVGRGFSQRIGNVEPARPTADGGDLDVRAQAVHQHADAFAACCTAEEFDHRGSLCTFADGTVPGTDQSDAAFPACGGHHAGLRFGPLQPFAPAIEVLCADAESLDTPQR